MRREGREALAQVLGVADVGEQSRGPVDARTGSRGDVEAGPGAERGERDRLHRHRLAARVGTGEDQHAVRLAEAQVVRRPRARAAAGGDGAAAARRRRRRARRARPRPSRQRARHARRRGRVPRVRARLAVSSGASRPTSLDSSRSTRATSRAARSSASFRRLLASTTACGSMKSVVPDGRDVVDDAAHLATRIGPHGQHVAIVAHRDERVGEMWRDLRIAEGAVETSLELAARAVATRRAPRRAAGRPSRGPGPSESSEAAICCATWAWRPRIPARAARRGAASP